MILNISEPYNFLFKYIYDRDLSFGFEHQIYCIMIIESSSAGEFYPQALTDPDVNVSAHPALIIQSLFPATLPYPLAPPISG